MNKEKLIKLIIDEIKDVREYEPFLANLDKDEKEISSDYLTFLDFYLDEKSDFLKRLPNEEDLVVQFCSIEDSYQFFYKVVLSDRTDADKCYEILIGFRDEWGGYCECQPGDEGYNEKHRCCGEFCDWQVPIVEIVERKTIGGGQFKGIQKDLWKLEDEFVERYFGKNSLIEQEKKEEKERILSNIEQYKAYIVHLEEKLKGLE